MILVVADTSPLNYLVQIRCQGVLAALYERIFVPMAVFQELHHVRTPDIVHAWLNHLPQWIEVRAVRSMPDGAMAGLGPGEREAIQLACEEHADLLLMDERLGVSLAERRGLAVTGTLGVLIQAARRGLVDMDAALSDLRATDFRCTPELFRHAKERAQKGRNK